jgi:hypothetical protein
MDRPACPIWVNSQICLIFQLPDGKSYPEAFEVAEPNGPFEVYSKVKLPGHFYKQLNLTAN